ncbi:MAG: M28 family peptidase, partial [Verrucomicrobiae bacterium]|nr:M28 family peptidase [Verrucomicrobiae bacterium]NNJ86149.1 M28 family peptidase [Akkermansiaceae bacterium]
MKSKKVLIILAIACLVAGVFWWFNADKADQHGKAAYAHTVAILACGPRPPESEGYRKAQQYIAAELAKHGWSTMSQSHTRDTPVGEKTFVNLIARYQPGELNNLEDLKKLPTKGILGAHLDSKIIPGIPDFLGADDAASACALIIELAANLAKKNPDLAKQLEIVFFDGEEAFGENIIVPGYTSPADAEEDGLFGSRAYAVTLYGRKPKPSFGIILDMVGHKNLKIAIPGDTPPELESSMMKAAEKHGHSDRFGKVQPTQNNPQGIILDDHLYLNKAGVPTIDIIGADFSHSYWWHQEG